MAKKDKSLIFLRSDLSDSITQLRQNMLKAKSLRPLILFLFVILTFQCSKKLSYQYETEALEQGQQGTVMFKVYSYAGTVDAAIERAKMDAVHAVLFKGVPGSNVEDPIIKNPTKVQEEKSEYFKEFFGVEVLQERVREKGGLRYGRESADYRLYVKRSDDGSISPQDRMKVGGGYKVGVRVSVNHKQLRKRLEKDGIIKEFGL